MNRHLRMTIELGPLRAARVWWLKDWGGWAWSIDGHFTNGPYESFTEAADALVEELSNLGEEHGAHAAQATAISLRYRHDPA